MTNEIDKRCFFDEEFKTFRLYPGKSLYAFCITPELILEHLYWGKSLNGDYDLRYLSESSRMACFSTSEKYESRAASNIEIDNLRQAETIEEILEMWKKNRTSISHQFTNDPEEIQRRRMANLSWRMMGDVVAPPPSSVCQSPSKKNAGFYSTGTNGNLYPENTSKGEINELFDKSINFHTPDTSPKGSRKISANTESTSDRTLTSPNRSDLVSSPRYSRGRAFDCLNSQSLDSPPRRVKTEAVVANSLNSRTRSRSWSKSGNIEPQENEKMLYQRPSDIADLRIDSNAPSSFPGFGTPPPSSPSYRRKSVRTFERRGGKIGKGTLCVEYSDHGTGDFRTPSFSVIDNCDGSSISPLRYRKHLILRGKLPMPDNLPGIRSTDERASTLIVTMGDIGSGLEVDLIYVVLHDYDAVMRRAVFRNVDTRTARMGGKAGKVIQRACSFTCDFEYASTPFHMLQLSGSWGRERYIVETKLTQGLQSFGSVRGVSSHQHNPFAVITLGPPSETQGEVKGFSLIYSGNFIFEAELGEMGRLRTNMGIHPMGLQWYLKPGAVFNTPEAVLVRSDEGLGGMSRALHRLFIDKLIPPSWADQGSAPVLLNTWEALYFDVTHANVVEMAKQASQVDIDLIVLDDGWFGKRNDTTTSLGDWTTDLTKFPLGLRGLVEEVNAAGCKFGLWIEPEMVSEDSCLHSLHPDWYLCVPNRPRQIGRNQFVLDLSRKEIVDYLFEAISTVLSDANIEYLKWDMNRPLTEVFSQRNILSPSSPQSLAAVWQSETSHRFVLGLYELQGRIIKAFPHVMLENCSSGGGRFDPGMLYFSPQIWCSDNTDALTRMKIQYGTSMAYPARSIGAHVSCIPNHITGNSTRIRTRGFVAMCGTFGFELDICAASNIERMQYKELVTCYRAFAPIIRRGDLFRLWDPFKNTFAAWMYVTQDKSEAVVFAFSLNSDHWSNLVPRLALQGLIPDAIYEVGEPLPNNVCQNSVGGFQIIESEFPLYQLGFSTVRLTGDILMSAGLPIKFYTLDDSLMFTLIKVPPYEINVRSRCPTITPPENMDNGIENNPLFF